MASLLTRAILIILVNIIPGIRCAVLERQHVGGCVPQCPLHDPAVPLIRDPLSCTHYYLCEGGQPGSRLSCPVNTSFVPGLAVCAADTYPVLCETDPTCTSEVQLRSSSIHSPAGRSSEDEFGSSFPHSPDAALGSSSVHSPEVPVGSSPNFLKTSKGLSHGRPCHYTCRGAEDLTADSFDCSAYYYCQNGVKYGPFFCPEDRPHFTGDHCEIGSRKCCRPRCLVQCDGSSVIIEDPLDCRAYYLCIDEGAPSPDVRFQCMQNTVIGKTGACIPGKKCAPMCHSSQADRLMTVASDLLKVADLTSTHPDLELLEGAATRLEYQHYMDWLLE